MASTPVGNIDDAFAILLDEIEAEVKRITKEGQAAFAQRDFARAASLGKEAEAIEVYVARVKSLKQDRSSIVRTPATFAPNHSQAESTVVPVPAESTTPVMRTQPSSIRSVTAGTVSTRSGAPRSFRARTGGPRASSDDITPQQAFRVPILEILVELGGSARKVVVEEKVYARMRNILKPADFKGHQSRTNQIRWKNSAQWSRAGLVEEGLMIPTSPRGVWEISEAGREWLAIQQSLRFLGANAPVQGADETEHGLPGVQKNAKGDGSRRSHKNLAQGKRTHEHAFRVPILTAIEERGGRAEVGELMEAIYRIMKDSFNEHDLEDTPNSRGEPRWSNNARFCRQVMINKGWLRSGSPRGVWEITDAGRRWLAAENAKRG